MKVEHKYNRRGHLIFEIGKDNAIFVGKGNSINAAKRESRRLQSISGHGSLKVIL